MATWPTIIDDDGSNTTGTIVNNAGVWTPIKGYIDSLGGTPWAPLTGYTLGVTGGAGSWTIGSAGIYFSVLPGPRRVLLDFYLTNAVVTTAVGLSSLDLLLPATAPVPAATAGATYHYFGPGTGYVQITGPNKVAFLKDMGGSAWTAGTFHIAGQIGYLY